MVQFIVEEYFVYISLDILNIVQAISDSWRLHYIKNGNKKIKTWSPNFMLWNQESKKFNFYLPCDARKTKSYHKLQVKLKFGFLYRNFLWCYNCQVYAWQVLWVIMLDLFRVIFLKIWKKEAQWYLISIVATPRTFLFSNTRYYYDFCVFRSDFFLG